MRGRRVKRSVSAHRRRAAQAGDRQQPCRWHRTRRRRAATGGDCAKAIPPLTVYCEGWPLDLRYGGWGGLGLGGWREAEQPDQSRHGTFPGAILGCRLAMNAFRRATPEWTWSWPPGRRQPEGHAIWWKKQGPAQPSLLPRNAKICDTHNAKNIEEASRLSLRPRLPYGRRRLSRLRSIIQPRPGWP